MGYVTRTESTGEIMVSHTFESYDDFVKWSMIQDDLVPNPFEEASSEDGKYTLTLDEHEVYTLRLLLGYCLDTDTECNSIHAKLDEIAGGELDCDDYNRLYFQYVNEDGDVEELHDGDKEVTIKFK
jgi:hypothetical protein